MIHDTYSAKGKTVVNSQKRKLVEEKFYKFSIWQKVCKEISPDNKLETTIRSFTQSMHSAIDGVALPCERDSEKAWK